MPLTLQIPHQPANADGFFSFTLVQQGTTYQYTLNKDLFSETVNNLRVLAKKVGLSGSGRMKKAELAAALEPYVFFTPREEALAAWPILDEPLEDTERDLRDQSLTLRASAGYLDPAYLAHFRQREAEVQAAIKTLEMEAERQRQREKGRLPPAWWKIGRFVEESDWDESDAPAHPYLKVIVEATERGHDGYCSGIDICAEGHPVCCYSGEAIEVEERTYKMIGCLPLKDEKGASWNFQGPDFDPGWGCSSDGSGVCGIRPSVRFISMERVE
jgi:hypothetical protein